ncbi:MAG: hypothetical protein RSA08_04290 [Clostridia bacterium]
MKQKINIKKIFDLSKFTNFQKLILLIVLLCFLLMGTKLFEKLRLNDEIKKDFICFDYSTVTGEYLVSTSLEENDRKLYWELDSIVKKYILSYQSIEKFESYNGMIKYDGPSVTDFYECLYKKYKVSLNKKEYMEISKKFMKKFVSKVQYYDTLLVDNVINSVYRVQENMYICQLNTSIDNTTAYLGIKLDKEKNTYNIFYIE